VYQIKRFSVPMVFYPHSTTFKRPLWRVEDVIPKDKRSGLYRVDCNDCPRLSRCLHW